MWIVQSVWKRTRFTVNPKSSLDIYDQHMTPKPAGDFKSCLINLFRLDISTRSCRKERKHFRSKLSMMTFYRTSAHSPLSKLNRRHFAINHESILQCNFPSFSLGLHSEISFGGNWSPWQFVQFKPDENFNTRSNNSIFVELRKNLSAYVELKNMIQMQ